MEPLLVFRFVCDVRGESAGLGFNNKAGGWPVDKFRAATGGGALFAGLTGL